MPGDVRGGMLGAPGVTALGRSEAIKVYWAEDAEIWIFFPERTQHPQRAISGGSPNAINDL